MRPTLIVPLVCVLLFSAPAVFAGWSGKGAYEPDTLYDTQGGWMYAQPDISANQSLNKVYFNGFLGQCTFPCLTLYATFNPNLGLVRSGFTTTLTYHVAIFGVWKDCNQDNFIGFGDQGLMEYRSELLLDKSVCPVVQTPVGAGGLPPLDWFPSHNDGTWVREYLPFAGRTLDINGHDTNPWNINAEGTKAWVDDGLPGPLSGGGTCYINPQPVGTMHNAGGMVAYADCFNGYQLTHTFNNLADSSTVTKPFSFSDKPDGEQGNSSSRLNVKPWGETSDASLVQVWDCSRPQTNASTPAVPQASVASRSVNVSAPRVPPIVTPTGSLAGTMYDAFSGVDQCSRNPSGTAYTVANAPYRNEGTIDTTAKRATGDMGPGYGGFSMSNRPAAPASRVLGSSAPPDGGVRLVDNDGIWSGGAIGAGNGFVNPYALPPRIEPVHYVTYYGFVDPITISTYGLSLPKGGATNTYGQEACGAATNGVIGGWDCNPADWLSGNKIGDPYNMRDIDCYDQSVQAARAAGVSWGLLTSTKCASAP